MIKKRKNWIWIVGSSLLCLVGIGLIFSPYVRNQAINQKAKTLRVTKQTKQQLQKNALEKPATFDFQEVKPVTNRAVLESYQNSPQNLSQIGGIAIPDLRIHLAILKGLSNENLLYGAGTMSEDQVMGQGNYALASHSLFGTWGAEYTLFTPLHRAQKGMMAYLTDLDKIYQYQIVSVEEVTPEHTEVLNEVAGKKLLTLITCTDLNATKRIVVQGELVAISDYNNNKDKIFQ